MKNMKREIYEGWLVCYPFLMYGALLSALSTYIIYNKNQFLLGVITLFLGSIAIYPLEKIRFNKLVKQGKVHDEQRPEQQKQE